MTLPWTIPGIDREHINFTRGNFVMRGQKEVDKARKVLMDRIVYERCCLSLDAGHGGNNGPVAGAIYEEYGEEFIQTMSEFDWGVVNGMALALQWVMGQSMAAALDT